MKAFVLIEVATGKVASVVKAIHGVEGVKSADSVTGLYDIIAVVEASDSVAIGKVVTERIHTIDGVVRTLTCFAVKAE
jgi:DNA-binding Lrp family transcriptional regulator